MLLNNLLNACEPFADLLFSPEEIDPQTVMKLEVTVADIIALRKALREIQDNE